MSTPTGYLSNYAGDWILDRILIHGGGTRHLGLLAAGANDHTPGAELTSSGQRAVCTWSPPSNQTSGLIQAARFVTTPSSGTAAWWGVYGPQPALNAVIRITSAVGTPTTIALSGGPLVVPAGELVMGPNFGPANPSGYVVNDAYAQDLLENLLESSVTGASYLALHSEEPTRLGNPGSEFAGNDYARQPVTWTPSGARAMALSAQVDFEDLPNSELRWFGVWDAPAGSGPSAHLLAAIPRYTALPGPQTLDPLVVTTQQTLSVPAGDLVLTI